MRIQHNIAAMNSYRNFNVQNKGLSKNLEKLSSGYKINRAGDDAAGLAISEKMRAQITGLEVAQKNAKDGISVVQTAEGALAEVHDMLNRMYSLSEQSANGIYSSTERQKLQDEVDELASEIDRIADSTNFNGIKLLDGTMGSGSTTSGSSALAKGGDLTVSNVTDGIALSEAVKQKYTVTFNASATVDSALKLDTTAKTIASIAKYYDIYDEDGKAVAAASVAKGKTYTFEAKVAGEVPTALTIAVATKATVTEITKGANAGASTAAVYEVEIDVSKLTGGDYFQIGSGSKTGKIEFAAIASSAASTSSKAAQVSLFKLANATSASDVKAAFTANNAAKISGFGATNQIQISVTGSKATASKAATWKVKLIYTAGTAGTGGNKTKVEAGKMSGDRTSDTLGITVTQTTKGAAETPSTKAYGKAYYENFDTSQLKAGDKITFGSVTLKVVSNAYASNVSEGQVALGSDGSISETDLQNALKDAGYKGTISIDADNDNLLTITGIQPGEKGEDTAAGIGKVTIEKAEDSDVTTLGGTSSSSKGGLVLQIGDTADTFNQLTVQISDMHTKALFGRGTAANVATLNTSNAPTITANDSPTAQTLAQNAMKNIKSAIDEVSSTRGKLGAWQNRLEHTINNLSTTRENLTDAESSIRDTDVAEEMMKYTKNSILNQAAQAMLAQANQLPQGALQLLQ